MNAQLILSLVSGIFISGVAGYLGTLMLSRKMSVVAGPLAHLALPGAALAIIFGWSLFLGVFPFVLLGTLLIWALERRTKLPMENLAAIIFAFGLGTALLILPIDRAEAALIGSIGTISLTETVIVVVIASLTFGMTRSMYAKLVLAGIHEDLAQSSGVNVSLYNFGYLLSIGLVVSLGVYLVGGLITAALIAIPSAIAKNVGHDLRSYKIWAISSGIAATLVGIVLSQFYPVPTGPLIIVVGACLFVLTVLVKRK